MILVSVSSNLYQFVCYTGSLTIRILRRQHEFWMCCRQLLPNLVTSGLPVIRPKSAVMVNFGGGHRAKQSLHQPNLILPWSPPDSLERLLSVPDTRTWHGFANDWRRYCFVRYTMGAGSSTILKSAGTVNNERFGSARMMFVRRNVCSPIRGSLRLL